jgi:hypothetical protein
MKPLSELPEVNTGMVSSVLIFLLPVFKFKLMGQFNQFKE